MNDEQRRAAPCAGNTALFYSDNPSHQAEAQALCFGCPFQLACLADGLYEDYGIWGGTLPSTRKKARKKK